ncbi:hypothetical protein [Pseudooceanicola sp.]|uniref:hypothetical protein n=1 Tax=Pseudooceanicola sp. TaxID=1914328 RepID=UPI0035C7663B
MTAHRLTVTLLILWALVWVGSFALPYMLAPTGDGFTRGLNRLMAFFGLQIGAGAIGLLLVFIRPATGRIRWLALLPTGMAGLLIAALVGVIAWAQLSKPPHVPDRPAKPASQAIQPPTTAPADGSE